jgi:hypothetical protein
MRSRVISRFKAISVMESSCSKPSRSAVADRALGLD